MSYDDEGSVDDTYVRPYPDKPRPSSKKPWILFAVTLLILGAVVALGGKAFFDTRAELNAANERAAKALLERMSTTTAPERLDPTLKAPSAKRTP